MMRSCSQNASGGRRPSSGRVGRRGGRGYTLIEILTAMAVIGILASIVVPAFRGAIEKANIARAAGDLSSIAAEIDLFFVWNDRYPSSLGEIGLAGRTDPWGNAFVYVRLEGSKQGARKDRFLVPLNSDYDLYSPGKDGKSSAPLTAAASKDDVIRAMDGGYFGLAEKF